MESCIHLHDLEFDVRLGWLEDERKQPQQVLVELKLFFVTPPTACHTDQLHDTICYAKIIDELKQALSHHEFKLLEHLGHRIYSILKSNFSNEMRVGVRITKKIPIQGIKGFASFHYTDEGYT